MAVFKCKMCGADLPGVTEGNVVECEYCGSRQTIPTADNEKKVTLFARANRLRFGCEFDKAAGVYESIVAEFPTEAEAYWGLVLCKYGIEYVDDPKTGKKIPTCHRSSFDSVMEDDNLDQACENADAVARKVYRDEAKQIEELRKRIIEVSGREEPYDIFICYKETDENGSRTLDSVLAQDIYDALTAKGYRVFFARISLEDKLGQEYEPYIFAALNSAKVMLAVGTDYEYYNAVWVKNEWSRYLALIAAGQKKTLIPCYKNIDAYDMPKEFARLQAQDMGKVGAMQDLLRGIEKIIGGKQEESKPQSAGVDVAQIVQQVMKQNVSTGGESNAAALLKRGYMALSDGDWKKANEFFDRVLDGDAENAEAYMGKFLARKKKDSMESWAETYSEQTFQPDTLTLDLTDEQHRRITMAVQQNTVQGYLRENEILWLYPKKQTYASNVNDEKNNLNWMRQDCEDKDFVRAMQFAQGEVKARYDAAMAALSAKLNRRLEAAQAQEAQNIREAQEKLDKAFDEADAKAAKMKESAIQKQDQELETKYHDCCNRMNGAKSEYQYTEVRHGFEALGDYKDSREKAQQCEQLAQKWMDEQAAKKARSTRNKIIAAVAVVAIVAIAALAKLVIIPSVQYKAATAMVQNGRYDEAIATFKALDGYKDAAEQVKNAQYAKGEAMMAAGDYDGASAWYLSIEAYRWAQETQYQKGESLLMSGDYDGAKLAYQAAGDYSDAETKVKETQYQKGESLLATGDYDGATAAYQSANDYNDAATKAKEAQYQKGESLLAAGDYDSAIVAYQAAGNYSDAATKAKEAQCQKGESLMAAGDYDGAIVAYQAVGNYSDATTKAKEAQYQKGKSLLAAGDYDGATAAYQSANDYSDAATKAKEAQYQKGESLLAAGDYDDAITAYQAAGDYSDAATKVEEMQRQKGEVMIASDDYDGAVKYYRSIQQEDWVKDVQYRKGEKLLEDRDDRAAAQAFALAVGYQDALKRSYQIRYRSLYEGKIAAGYDHTVGLKSDGTVIAAGRNSEGQCNVSTWTDIVAVEAGDYYTVGLKSDGTVVAVGRNNHGQCNVSGWTDIVSIVANIDCTAGLKSDGTVVATGKDYSGKCDVDGWTDIVSIAEDFGHTVGLKSDGTIVTAGSNKTEKYDASGWTNIVSVTEGGYHMAGLKSNGTVIVTGGNTYGQCRVGDWTDIVSITGGKYHTVGLKSDGTVVATGYNKDKRCNVSGWMWTNIVAVAAGDECTLGLKSDGTVVATGGNKYGECDVSDWTDIGGSRTLQ